ncbi:MAG: hypothetical protein AAFQ07_06340, partial [Chloroflexota bacterium]
DSLVAPLYALVSDYEAVDFKIAGALMRIFQWDKGDTHVDGLFHLLVGGKNARISKDIAEALVTYIEAGNPLSDSWRDAIYSLIDNTKRHYSASQNDAYLRILRADGDDKHNEYLWKLAFCTLIKPRRELNTFLLEKLNTGDSIPDSTHAMINERIDMGLKIPHETVALLVADGIERNGTVMWRMLLQGTTGGLGIVLWEHMQAGNGLPDEIREGLYTYIKEEERVSSASGMVLIADGMAWNEDIVWQWFVKERGVKADNPAVDALVAHLEAGDAMPDFVADHMRTTIAENAHSPLRAVIARLCIAEDADKYRDLLEALVAENKNAKAVNLAVQGIADAMENPLAGAAYVVRYSRDREAVKEAVQMLVAEKATVHADALVDALMEDGPRVNLINYDIAQALLDIRAEGAIDDLLKAAMQDKIFINKLYTMLKASNVSYDAQAIGAKFRQHATPKALKKYDEFVARMKRR